MTLKTRFAVVAFVVSMALGPAANGQPMNDGEACLEGSGKAVVDEAYCRRALSRRGLADVERAALLVARAGALANLDEVPGALTEITRALVLNPGSAKAYLLRALLIRDVEAKLRDLDRAVALNPYFTDALAHRGAAYLRQGDERAALADFDQALSIRPRSSLALFFKGVLRFKQARYGAAETLFRRVLALAPVQHPIAALWLAAAVGRQGHKTAPVMQPYLWWWESGVWPSPLMQLWSGALGSDAAGAAVLARNGDARAQGAFFLAQ
ncbi:MAG: tetratricopeptide repeat protein, partial [Rhodospirillaceae bacterium]|nr:tetratricopeptide repeat protein [Rhodospirillaceae bacterium]